MLFAIDVGNTETVIGLFSEGGLLCNWRLSTDGFKTGDECGITFVTMLKIAGYGPKDVKGSIMSSSVPSLIGEFEYAAQKYFSTELIVVGPGIRTGMDIKYENPKDVSPDRIANSVAAFKKYGGPAVVVDFGAGTTFDAISKDGAYLGGAIAPGMLTAADSLFKNTARLPGVELVKPASAVGRNIVGSIQSGIVFGFAELADGMVSRISRELGGNCVVVATGKMAEMMSSICKTIDHVEPFLTLWGLRYIYGR